jgi:hypothetical protein
MAGGLYSLSNEDMRTIMDKKTATVGDAIYVIYSIDNPDAVIADIDKINLPSIKALNRDQNLDAGTLAIIAIEFGKAYGGAYYRLTGFSRYAAQSLVYDGIFPESFSWNRSISGKELIELTGAIKGHR